MQARFNSAEILMHKGQTFELGEAARSVVTGICGTVWLTREGDLADNLLGPGQSMVLGNDGHAWLSALGEARVRVEQKGRAPRRFIQGRLRSLHAAYLRFARLVSRGRGFASPAY